MTDRHHDMKVTYGATGNPLRCCGFFLGALLYLGHMANSTICLQTLRITHDLIPQLFGRRDGGASRAASHS